MMAGNPSWWSVHLFPPLFPSQYASIGSLSSSSSSSALSSSSSSLPLNPLVDTHHEELLPQSWSQLLPYRSLPLPLSMRDNYDHDQDQKSNQDCFLSKKSGAWEDPERRLLNTSSTKAPFPFDIKEEVSQNSISSLRHRVHEDQSQTMNRTASTTTSSTSIWSISSSPRSCISSLGNDMLDFSCNKEEGHSTSTFHHNSHRSSEYNSTATGGMCKKAKVQRSSSQPPLKVRKEKLGDRVLALHQLVSPFGKTDTASVLLEATGYIRFLHTQIEVLSSPCKTPNFINQRSDKQDTKPSDLRSRGMCLVPVSCTDMLITDGGPDYWPPAFKPGF